MPTGSSKETQNFLVWGFESARRYHPKENKMSSDLLEILLTSSVVGIFFPRIGFLCIVFGLVVLH